MRRRTLFLVAMLLAVSGCRFHAGFNTKRTTEAQAREAPAKPNRGLRGHPQINVRYRTQEQIQAEQRAADAAAERAEEEKENAFLDAKDRSRETSQRAAYEQSCKDVGGDAWAAHQVKQWTPDTGTACAKPDAAFLKEQEALRALEGGAEPRRRAAKALDEWALQHGLHGDAFSTDGQHDEVLVYETVFCSRQRVHRVIEDLNRANLRKLGFAKVYCENAIEEWWEAP